MNAPFTQKPDLQSLAREALAKAEGKTDEAIKILDRRLRRDSALRQSLIEEAVRSAAKLAIVTSHHIERFAVVQGLKFGRAAVKSLATGLTRTILDYPLLDGTKLRDATHAELDRAIQDYATKASTNAHRARWLSAIRDLVPVQGKVSDVVDDDTAHRLWQEAE